MMAPQGRGANCSDQVWREVSTALELNLHLVRVLQLQRWNSYGTLNSYCRVFRRAIQGNPQKSYGSGISYLCKFWFCDLLLWRGRLEGGGSSSDDWCPLHLDLDEIGTKMNGPSID